MKFDITNEPSLYQCNEMEDDSFIVVKGNRKKWRDMKKDYNTWEFDVVTSNTELSRLKSKFLTVWGKVGTHFCEKFDMEFITFNTAKRPAEANHYVLLLDSSGSMSGEPWKNLLAATSILVQARISRGTDDRLTIIPFADRANYFCVNRQLKDIDVSKVEFTNGGTDFAPAFGLVFDVVSSVVSASSSTLLKYIIVFMSDGEAKYPKQALDKLEPLLDCHVKEFWTIALGTSKMDILEQINQKMKGRFMQLKDSSELMDAYDEIAFG